MAGLLSAALAVSGAPHDALQPDVLGWAHRSSSKLSTISAPLSRGSSGITPVFWLHVPKTGSSFATTIAHFIAPGLPGELVVKDPTDNLNKYQGLIRADMVGRFRSGHEPLSDTDAHLYQGGIVMMMRRPFERTVSAFHHSLHDCPALQARYGCLEHSAVQSKMDACTQQANFTEYSECVSGCTARMLLGAHCGDDTVSARTRPTMAADAIDVVAKRVGFVGLTDHWAASVCLWHKRFGGKCLAAEFIDTRPGDYAPDTALATEWPGDPTEEAVFAAGAAQFWAQLEEHGLTSADACAAVCPDVERAHFEGQAYTQAEAEAAEAARASRATTAARRRHRSWELSL